MNTVDIIHNGNIPQSLLEASDVAEQWHNGQWCPLYALSCGVWHALTTEDMRNAAIAAEAIAEPDHNLEEMARTLRRWTDQHPPQED